VLQEVVLIFTANTKELLCVYRLTIYDSGSVKRINIGTMLIRGSASTA